MKISPTWLYQKFPKEQNFSKHQRGSRRIISASNWLFSTCFSLFTASFGKNFGCVQDIQGRCVKLESVVKTETVARFKTKKLSSSSLNKCFIKVNHGKRSKGFSACGILFSVKKRHNYFCYKSSLV